MLDSTERPTIQDTTNSDASKTTSKLPSTIKSIHFNLIEITQLIYFGNDVTPKILQQRVVSFLRIFARGEACGE
jgi:hypothetical protein